MTVSGIHAGVGQSGGPLALRASSCKGIRVRIPAPAVRSAQRERSNAEGGI